MRRLLSVLSIALAAAPVPPLHAQQASAPAAARDTMSSREAVMQLLAAFDRAARSDLWPGFRPDTIPLAVYDGAHTWLVRHRAPPAPFQRDPTSALWVMDGRHPAVTANSSAQIGGQLTATLLPNFAKSPPRRWAAVLAHETFHAFERAHHRTWAANEGDLFTYPFTDVSALADRRLEFEALRRALAARSTSEVRCWAAEALRARSTRFIRSGTAAATYERKGELNEGLAQYVESRAAGERALPLLPDTEYAIDGVRDRIYKSGLAFGQLLDRLQPSWRAVLDRADSSASLDGALQRAVGTTRDACAFRPEEVQRQSDRARQDSAAFETRLATAERELMSRSGWSVRVVAEGAPLQVAGFDPLNVSRLTTTRVLHRRYLKVTGGDGSLEIFNRDALTEAAGSHPVFAGIRSILITGIENAPAVRDSSGTLVLEAPGVSARFGAARADTTGTRITVHLPR